MPSLQSWIGVQMIERVTTADFAHWLRRADDPYAELRALEVARLCGLVASAPFDSSEIETWSDWLQRRAAIEAHRLDVLERSLSTVDRRRCAQHRRSRWRRTGRQADPPRQRLPAGVGAHISAHRSDARISAQRAASGELAVVRQGSCTTSCSAAPTRSAKRPFRCWPRARAGDRDAGGSLVVRVEGIVTVKQDPYGERVRLVLDALRAEVVEVSDLHKYRVRPRDAARVIPVLRGVLDEERLLAVAEAAAHAVAVPELVDEVLPDLARRIRGPFEGYRYDPSYDGPGDANEDMRFAFGSAISLLSSPRTAETMLELAGERPLGFARSPVVTRLRRTRAPAVPGLLVELLDDPTVAAAAIAALRGLGHREVLPAIRALHDAPDPEVRRQVRSVLRAWRDKSSPS